MEMAVQAITDYKDQASDIFRDETDLPQDIAEDVMREAIESMGFSGMQERLYGKVDYKKAIYAFIPQAYPVALMLDAKAEKGNGSATIQMSQTSMRVQFLKQNGDIVDERGKLFPSIRRGNRTLHVVTIVCKFIYAEPNPGTYSLIKIIIACIPNLILQNRYNPNPDNTIWRAGRHAPTLGEEFRVRLSFSKLKKKSDWRVRTLQIQVYNPHCNYPIIPVIVD